jgi:hypothetical protein
MKDDMIFVICVAVVFYIITSYVLFSGKIFITY